MLGRILKTTKLQEKNFSAKYQSVHMKLTEATQKTQVENFLGFTQAAFPLARVGEINTQGTGWSNLKGTARLLPQW